MGPMGPQIFSFLLHQALGPHGPLGRAGAPWAPYGAPRDPKFGIFFPWSGGAGHNLIRPHVLRIFALAGRLQSVSNLLSASSVVLWLIQSGLCFFAVLCGQTRSGSCLALCVLMVADISL